MKVQLIVVQGKPEGKMIPLVGPKFKIGRGETCNLRPNSEEVSREHAEFAISADKVQICDLGSRNGTLLNGKRLNAKELHTLKDSDLIQIGPLTFAISIQGVPVPVAAKGPAKAPAKPASLDEPSHADIESWLVSDESSSPPERPSGIYGGDTRMMEAYQAGPEGKSEAGEEATDEAEGVVDDESETRDEVETVSDEEETETAPEELVDESNPFYVAQKQKSEPPAAKKQPAKDSSDAASDILRRLMERRRPH
jgi:predicted component of type VI protein secretion system